MPQKTVYVELIAETKKLNAGMKKADKRISNTTKMFKRLGTAMIAAFSARAVLRGIQGITRGLGEAVKTTDALIKTAQGVGFTATEYERLTFALSEVGVGAESARIALGDFQKRLARPSFQKFFREAGFKPEELLKLPAEEQLMTVLTKLADLRDDPRLASVAGLIFEEQSGKDIRKALIQWDKFLKARKDYERIVRRGLTEKDIANIESMGSETRKLGLRWTVLKRNIVLQVVPDLLDALEKLEEAGTFEAIADEVMKFANAISEVTKDIQFLSKVFSDFLNIGAGKGVKVGSKAEAAGAVAKAALSPLSPFPATKAAFGLFRQGRISSDAPPMLNRWLAPPVAAPQPAGPTAQGGWPAAGTTQSIRFDVTVKGDTPANRKTASKIWDTAKRDMEARQ